MFTKISTVVVILAIVALIHPLASNAQTNESPTEAPTPQIAAPEYVRGKVTEIVEEKTIAEEPKKLLTQTLKIQLDGDPNQAPAIVTLGSEQNPISQDQIVKAGQRVILIKQTFNNQSFYQLVEVYRIHYIVGLLVGFFILVLLISGRRGWGAIAGLILTAIVILKLIVPQILAGGSVIFYTVVGGMIIMTASLYLAHGFNKKTTVSIVATGATLVLVGLISSVIIQLFNLTGLGNDQALFLQLGTSVDINLRGLLLSGIMIGTLGVLDDITTSQTAIVYELHHSNPHLTAKELYGRGLNVGREHIASLVNTLVLAYAGSSLPLFMLFQNDTYYPLWVSLNFEFIVEEIVRTIVGSAGLILAVPLTTFLAAQMVTRTPVPAPHKPVQQ